MQLDRRLLSAPNRRAAEIFPFRQAVKLCQTKKKIEIPDQPWVSTKSNCILHIRARSSSRPSSPLSHPPRRPRYLRHLSKCLDDVLPMLVTPNLAQSANSVDSHTPSEWQLGRAERGASGLSSLAQPASTQGAAHSCSACLASPPFMLPACPEVPSHKQTPSPRPSPALPCMSFPSHPDPPSDSFTTSPAAAPPQALPPSNCHASIASLPPAFLLLHITQPYPP